MIRCEGVRYRFPDAREAALDGITLEIADGELCVVSGPSGSGKSTLARALTGLVPHTTGGLFEGRITVAGRDTRTHPPRALADVIGFVSQHPEAQGVTDRVEDEIVFGMENLGVDPVTMRKRLEETLDALGLAPLRERALDTLSGGERQRLAIASSLAMQPRCLVLDEPTSQLDPQSAEDVLAILQRLHADLGLTIVLVEHRLERVVQHADRLVVLEEGRVIADGAPRAVLGEGAVATSLSSVARALRWEPLPLTVREGRAFARALALEPRARATPGPGEELVRARGVHVALRGQEILRGVDVSVRAGEALAIVGRNGAGKTTLLRALAGLVRAHRGTRELAGLDVSRTPVDRIARRVGFVPQNADALLFHGSVREEVAFTLAARAPQVSVADVLAEADLGPFAAAPPRDLSAGQRLRVAIAAATAGDPPVVLLDEPTRGMDPASKEWLARAIARWRAAGRAVVLVTHDVELVARAATRVQVLAGGRTVVEGPVEEVLGASPLFSSQMNKVFDDRRILTVEDALAAVGAR